VVGRGDRGHRPLKEAVLMLRCEGLRKSYNGRPVLREVGFQLSTGAWALQGPNGCGKSTLLRLLAGAEEPDAGDIRIAGIGMREAPLRARQRLSYAPDESPIYPFLTGSDLLDFVSMAKKRPLDAYVVGLIDEFGLRPFMGVRFSHLSLGSQKKLVLCAAWIGEPDVLLLDEPSNGLDLDSRDFLAELICRCSREKTILFASHDADFVAAAEANVLAMEDLSLVAESRNSN
jgi:ABC-2 type transport system ATP-binding protein